MLACFPPCGVKLYNFLKLPIGQDASFWQWFWRHLYCLYRLVSALANPETNVQSQSVFVQCAKKIVLLRLKRNDSNDTLDDDDDAHKVNLHTRSYFFCIR